jgi:competence protein ComEC
VWLLTVLLLFTACAPPFGGGGGPAGTAELKNPGLTVYFLDVGQTASALVLCEGEAMLIDGSNAADSDLVCAFLKEHGVSHKEPVIPKDFRVYSTVHFTSLRPRARYFVSHLPK